MNVQAMIAVGRAPQATQLRDRLHRWRRACVLGVLTVVVVLGSAVLVPAQAQAIEFWRQMNQPTQPFRILGNLYYVGASDVTSFLIATPDGHILIDSGFAETVPLIRQGFDKLGFNFKDVKILLNSHGHIDHAGGLARIKALTQATFMASELEAPLLESGGRIDVLLGEKAAYEPVEVDRRLKDGDTVELGGTKLTARVTPGHTPGCTSWEMQIREGERWYTAVSVCSLTVLPDARVRRQPTYPNIAADFRRSFEALRDLPVDLFLASHAQFFGMADKRARLERGEDPNPFIDPQGYAAYVDRAERRFRERWKAEAEGSD